MPGLCYSVYCHNNQVKALTQESKKCTAEKKESVSESFYYNEKYNTFCSEKNPHRFVKVSKNNRLIKQIVILNKYKNLFFAFRISDDEIKKRVK